MRTTGPRFVTALAVAFISVSAAACSSESEDADPAYAYKALATRFVATIGGYSLLPTTLTGSLPSRTYVERDGGQAQRVSDLTVLGKFAGYERGDATSWAEPDDTSDSDSGKKVPWDSKEADTRTVFVTFRVSSVVDETQAERIDDGTQLKVRIVVNGDKNADAVAKGLEAVDDTVLFLQHRDEVWSIALNGGLIGEVASGGKLVMRVNDLARSEGDTPPIEIDVTTLDQLRAAAESDRTIEIK